MFHILCSLKKRCSFKNTFFVFVVYLLPTMCLGSLDFTFVPMTFSSSSSSSFPPSLLSSYSPPSIHFSSTPGLGRPRCLHGPEIYPIFQIAIEKREMAYVHMQHSFERPPKIRKSGNLEIRESGNPEIRKSGRKTHLRHTR